MGVVLRFVQATFPLYPLPTIEPGQKVYSRLRFAHKDMHLHTHEHMHTILSRIATPWTSSRGQMVVFSLLQQIFPMQELNRCPALQVDPLQLSYQGRPEHWQANFKAMPPGEERLADLQVICQPPPSPSSIPANGASQ